MIITCKKTTLSSINCLTFILSSLRAKSSTYRWYSIWYIMLRIKITQSKLCYWHNILIKRLCFFNNINFSITRLAIYIIDISFLLFVFILNIKYIRLLFTLYNNTWFWNHILLKVLFDYTCITILLWNTTWMLRLWL